MIIELNGTVIQGCKAKNGGALAISGGGFSIYSCHISGCTATTGGAAISINGGASAKNIYGGVFENSTSTSTIYNAKSVTISGGVVFGTISGSGTTTISGGCFSEDYSDYAASDKQFVELDKSLYSGSGEYGDCFGTAETMYEVKAAEAESLSFVSIAQDGDTPMLFYMSLQEAVSSATYGSESNPVIIRLFSDVYEDSLTLATTQYVKLDLNGHAIDAGGNDKRIIENKGHLTIVDSNPDAAHTLYKHGNIYTTAPAGAEGTLEITGGVLCGGKTTDASGAGILNSGTLDFQAGTLAGCYCYKNKTSVYGGGLYNTGTATLSAVIRNCVANGGGANLCVNGASAVMTLKEGALISGGSGGGAGANSLLRRGTYNIEGGTIEKGNGFIAYSDQAWLNISGGVINDNVNVTKAAVNVSGGTINGTLTLGYYSSEITGGIIKQLAVGTTEIDKIKIKFPVAYPSLNITYTVSGGWFNSLPAAGDISFFTLTGSGWSSALTADEGAPKVGSTLYAYTVLADAGLTFDFGSLGLDSETAYYSVGSDDYPGKIVIAEKAKGLYTVTEWTGSDGNTYAADDVFATREDGVLKSGVTLTPKTYTDSAVAKFGDTKYASLTEALAAGTTGTVTLLGDIQITSPFTIPAGSEIILDLNGFSLGGNSTVRLFTVNGKLTVTDTSDQTNPHYFESGQTTKEWTSNGNPRSLTFTQVTPAHEAGSDTITLFGGVVYGGWTTGSGGAFTVANTGSLTLGNVTVIGCAAGTSGGAVSVSYDKDSNKVGELSLHDTVFLYCTARANGGAVAGSGNVSGEDVTVRYCNALSHGGAFQVGTPGTLSLTNCTIEYCSAKYNGGAIACKADSFTMTGGKIAYCYTQEQCGGGICVYGAGTNKVNGVEFDHCEAKGTVLATGDPSQKGKGGAVSNAYNDGDYSGALTLENCNVHDCTAADGGDAVFAKGATVTICGGTVSGTLAKEADGKLAVESGWFQYPVDKADAAEGYFPTGAVLDGLHDGTPYSVKKIPTVACGNHTASLTLGGDIGLNFYLDLQDIFDQEHTNPYFILVRYGKNENGGEKIVVTQIPLSECSAEGSVYRVICSVAPAEVCDQVQILYGWGESEAGKRDGTEVPVIAEGKDCTGYSVKTYCDAVAAASTSDAITDQLKTLCAALLDYGSAVQTGMNYNVDHLASTPNFSGYSMADAIADLKNMKVCGYTVSGTPGASGKAFLLQSQSAFRIYFASQPEGVSLTDDCSWCQVRQGQEGEVFYVDVYNIASMDLEREFTLCVNDATVKASALTYIYEVLYSYKDNDSPSENDTKNINVAKAMILYCRAANAYFGD